MLLKRYKILIDIFIFLFSFSVFYLATHNYAEADITVHTKSILLFNKGEVPIGGHFLFFLIISLLSFFSENYNTIVVVSCVVLSLMTILKRIVTEQFFDRINGNIGSRYYFLLSVGFIFLINMPTHPPFKGLWPPITWINSTSIFVLPLCMILFYYSYIVSDKFTIVHFLKLLLLSLLIIISKPSYIFIFIIVFPILVLIRNRKLFIKSILFCVILIALISLQHEYIYHYYINKIQSSTYQHITIGIKLFGAWSRISQSIIVSAITWFALPISILILYGKQLIKEHLYLYALMGFVIGLLIFICLEELLPSGNAYGSVNFLWQLVISLYIWSVVSISFILKFIRERGFFTWKDKVILCVFLYYVAGGLLYLFNTVFIKLIIT